MPSNPNPIGIFDSGVGGLTVMRAVADLLPHEDLVYLGDTARVPYGNRGADTVRRYALNATRLLVDQGIKALVVACNTASAFALQTLKQSWDLPIVGVIDPVAARAIRTTRSGEVAVIGTRGTVRSGGYPEALARLGAERTVRVHQRACPLFVPLAEEGWTDGEVVEAVASRYLADLASSEIDTMILGCTHYPLLTTPIGRVAEQVMGRPVTLLDSASATAEQLRELLAAHGLLADAPRSRRLRFLATDDPQQFHDTATRFFGAELGEVEHVDIIDVPPGTTADAPDASRSAT